MGRTADATLAPGSQRPTMKAHGAVLGTLAAAIAILAFPPGSAATLVPPGNSAATQYTEAFPTAGGSDTRGKQKGHRSPARVLGARNARGLEAAGPPGRAAAEVAALTAPDEGGVTRGSFRGRRHRIASAGGSGGTASGVGEVIAQATGSSSSGELGLLMPVLIVAAIAASLVYLWRQRRHAA